MKSSNQKIMTTLLVMVLASMMTACGSSQAESTDLASRESSSSTDSSRAVAVCNYGSVSGLAAKQKGFVDSSNTYRFEYVWVKLTTLPSGFSSGSNYISMFKWFATSSSTYLDSTRLNFALWDTQTSKYITGWKTTLNWSDISATALSMGYSDPTSFFNRVTLLVNLNDASGQYDALKIASYDSTTNKVLTQLDSLLPLFPANPTAYATETDGTARAAALQAIHPFASYKSAGYSTSQFQAMAQNFCF
ncbi:MAG: hypothetical protein J7501_18625 [Bdellovibrio sp.]|nr:hypothetical protein [Bdellovibrio sp.]